MKHVKTIIRQITIPGMEHEVLEARVAVVDTENPSVSPYDKMISMPLVEGDEDRAKARMFDSLCKLLGEAGRMANE